MKKIMSLIVLFVISILVVGCSNDGAKDENEVDASKGKENKETSEKQTVTFWHAMGGEIQGVLDEIVADFNGSQDDIEVKAEFQGTYDEALTKYHSVAGTDNVPSIIQVFEIGTMSMINSDSITPIQELIDADNYDMSNLEENIINYYKVDDTFYSMPFNSSTPVMYYNKDAFKKAGLDPENPPATYEEVEEASKKIVEKNEGMKGFSLQAYGWLFEQLLANQGALLMNNDNGRSKEATEIGFKEEEGKSIFKWAENMIKDDTFANYGTDGDAMIAGFIAEDVSMFLQSSASTREVIDNAPFEVGVAYLPHPEKKDREGVVIGGASLWMPSGNEDAEQKAAWEFMKYLQTAEVQAKWHIGTGYFAINPEAYEEEAVKKAHEDTPQLKVTIDQLQSTKSTYATQGALMDMIPEARRIVETSLEEVYNGGEVDKAYESAVEQMNEAITQSNTSRGK